MVLANVVMENCTFRTVLVLANGDGHVYFQDSTGTHSIGFDLYRATNGTRVQFLNVSSSATSYLSLTVSALVYEGGSDVDCLTLQYPSPLGICCPCRFWIQLFYLSQIHRLRKSGCKYSRAGEATWLREDTLTNYTAAPNYAVAVSHLGLKFEHYGWTSWERSRKYSTSVLPEFEGNCDRVGGYRALWEWVSRTASSTLAVRKSANHKRLG